MDDRTPHPDAPSLAAAGDGTYYGPARHVPGRWLVRHDANGEWTSIWGGLPAAQFVQAKPPADLDVHWSAAIAQELTVRGPTVGPAEVGGCSVSDGQVMLVDRHGAWIIDVGPGGMVPAVDDPNHPRSAPVSPHFDDCDRQDGHPGCCPFIECGHHGCGQRAYHEGDHGPADQ